ncbi:MAG TPA: asparagine synthase (glutamine-hydrolyzing) [Thermodesulfobacteriota bacterium]
MCGIAGIIDPAATPERRLIERMCRVMSHRGPDGEGYYVEGPAALGHRRLSIIDLEGGAQPISNEDGTLWLTFNGEIYNFMGLRDDLVARGHVFRTRSDSETIVHAFEEYGEDCLERLRGMFAFAIWDSVKKELFMARDRLGKKPLYYYADRGRLLFASELKAILEDSRVPRELDTMAVADYFTYHYVPFPGTIFKGIRKLPPGHFLRFSPGSGGELAVKQYWDVKYEPDHTLTEEDWAQAIREKLEEAVRIRLVSDVPLGAFLSGGIDSSAVVAMMSLSGARPINTFSIGFREKDFSELEYARMVSERFGTTHHELTVEPDAIALLPKLAWDFDEPFADSSAIPTYYVSKMAREHVTVILSGDGGDEVFAGYRRYLWANDMTKYDFVPAPVKRIFFGATAAMLPDGMRGKGMLTHLSKDPFQRYAGLNTHADNGYLGNLLSDTLLKELEGRELPGYWNLRRFYESFDGDYLSRIQYADTKTYLAEDILTKVDRASMLNSLETRAPLLDHELVELAARIPSAMKVRKNETKYMLKKAMSGILPDEILYRRKMGFGVPLVHWFKKDLKDYAREVLLTRQARERGLFNTRHIEGMLDSHMKTGRDMSARIWALLFFEHWCAQWLKP